MDNLTELEKHIVTYWELRPFEREEPEEWFHTNELIAIIDRLSAELSQTRKARLEELLAAEIAEKVETRRGKDPTGSTKGTWFGTVFLGDSDLFYIHGTEKTLHPMLAYVPFPEGLDLCLSAALDAKRKREEGVGL